MTILKGTSTFLGAQEQSGCLGAQHFRVTMTNRLDDECNLLRTLRRSDRIFDLICHSCDPELSLQRRLRREFSEGVVRAAMTLAELRLKAVSKFTRADRMWFDRSGLEQATAEPVARHKAKRFQGRVWDFCTGIGSDAVALAGRGEVIGVDVNSAACLRAKWNAEVYGVQSNLQLVCADVERMVVKNGLVHVDPDRRAGGQRRSVRLEDYVPRLDALRQIMQECSGGAVKLSPASNFAGKFTDVEIELVSLRGECKEATIWFGELAASGVWRATVLPSGESLAGDPLETIADFAPLDRYIFDPDPAIVRAGLLDLLAERLGLHRLDAAEEYLTSPRRVDSPFVRRFEVLAELPNNQREIRRFFRQSDFGQVEIKCRHIPIQPDAVRRKLPLSGDKPVVLIFARVDGKARAVVCRRTPLIAE